MAIGGLPGNIRLRPLKDTTLVLSLLRGCAAPRSIISEILHADIDKILEVCYKSGIRVVTVYAFSIENFKRSKYEVNALMDMAKVKVSQLAQHGEILDRYGARIQFLGQKEMVRPDVLEAIEGAIKMTSHNEQYVGK